MICINRTKLAFISVTFTALSGCVTAPPTSNMTTAAPPIKPVEADARLVALAGEYKSRVEAGEFQSMAIGLIENGDVVWAETWGWADRDAGVKATTQTAYGIASAGKSVTATAAMKLAQEGKLDLDTEITDILGDDAVTIYAGETAPTVRELLNMTGGVPHGALTYRIADHPNDSTVMKSRAIVALPAGASFHYSNFAIALVDKVIEKVSGQSFPSFLEEEIFAPLGMSDSSIGLDKQASPAPAARYFNDGEPVGEIYPYPRSSRQMRASLSDLLKYTAFHMKTPMAGQIPVLTDANIDAIQSERSDQPGAHIALGIGNIDIGDGKSWVVTSGNDMGVQSNISIAHDLGIGVVVLTNSSGYQADELAIRAIDAAAPGFFDRVISALGAFEGRTKPFAATADWAGEWRGGAKSAYGGIDVSMRFEANDAVTIKLQGQDEMTIEEASLRDGYFTGRFEGILPLEEQSLEPHQIELGLQLVNGDLVGFILSNFENDRGNFQIPTPIRLSKMR